jgi:hypothetical protein
MGLFRALGALFGRGGSQPERSWDDPVDIAVTTVPEIVSGQRPVLVVIRDAGIGGGLGGWQFLDGENSIQPPVAIAKSDLLALDPTLKEVTDLPVGWLASRSAPDQPWVRERYKER